uniref:Uncharacterized protein n=1 Tax=Astyanax mexicanus TaxID=7994 RepID=A0A8B9KPZ3_ASTMX
CYMHQSCYHLTPTSLTCLWASLSSMLPWSKRHVADILQGWVVQRCLGDRLRLKSFFVGRCEVNSILGKPDVTCKTLKNKTKTLTALKPVFFGSIYTRKPGTPGKVNKGNK